MPSRSACPRCASGSTTYIRELRNVLYRARLFADGGIVRAEHLPEALGCGTAASPPATPRVLAPGPRQALSDADLARLASSFGGTRRELAT